MLRLWFGLLLLRLWSRLLLLRSRLLWLGSRLLLLRLLLWLREHRSIFLLVMKTITMIYWQSILSSCSLIISTEYFINNIQICRSRIFNKISGSRQIGQTIARLRKQDGGITESLQVVNSRGNSRHFGANESKNENRKEIIRTSTRLFIQYLTNGMASFNKGVHLEMNGKRGKSTFSEGEKETAMVLSFSMTTEKRASSLKTGEISKWSQDKN